MPGEKTRGYVLGAVAAASYGLNPLFALPLYGAGLGPDSVLFYRYLLAVVMLGSLMIFRRQSFALTRRDILPLAVMGLLFSFSSLCLFASYNYMDAGIASTILFLYPVMVAVIMSACFGERVTASTVLSILLALGGIALLYKGGDGATLSLAGVALVFLSSLCYAVYIVGVNRSSLRDLSTEKLTFYSLFFGLSVYLVRLRGVAGLQMIPSPLLWINAVSLALFPTIVSLVTMAGAIRRIGSTPTAILGALEPVTALFFRRAGLRRTAHAAHSHGCSADSCRRDAHHRRQVAPHPDRRDAPRALAFAASPAALDTRLAAPSAAAAPAARGEMKKRSALRSRTAFRFGPRAVTCVLCPRRLPPPRIFFGRPCLT